MRSRTCTDLFTGKAVQHGLCRENTGKLQTIWIEEPPLCNLGCPYCYARGGERCNRRKCMTRADYLSVLDQSAAMGVDSIGIPGAGEPFFGSNRTLTMWLLHQCDKRGMYVTLFTTGELIDWELAKRLYDLPVELMLKGNSLQPDRQDQFVSDPRRGIEIHGYGSARNAALQLLMRVGFNDRKAAQAYGRESRMALVTSIMTSENAGGLSNLDEIAEIYRWCRRHNVIADIDTILQRGRALECGLQPGDRKIMTRLAELRRIAMEEFGDTKAALSSTYVETVCDRYCHHLYVDVTGKIRPCIGAMDVDLGNIRTTTLEAAWNSEERKIIRDRKFDGPCAICANFQEMKCHSCLGRRARDLNNESLLRDGCVHTLGCPLFRKL